MDPNANLEELRRIAGALLAGSYSSAAALQADAYRLAELCEALDGWILAAGFLPRDWEPATEARRLIPGEKIPTTNGVREVLAVNVDNGRQQVFVTVDDPNAGPPGFVATISYALGQRVRVVKP